MILALERLLRFSSMQNGDYERPLIMIYYNYYYSHKLHKLAINLITSLVGIVNAKLKCLPQELESPVQGKHHIATPLLPSIEENNLIIHNGRFRHQYINNI